MKIASTGLALLLLAAAAAGAQDPNRGGRGGRRGGARDSLGQGMAAVTQAIERLVRTQVQPTDDQMARIRQIDQRMRPRRLELDRDEQQTRKHITPVAVGAEQQQGRIGFVGGTHEMPVEPDERDWRRSISFVALF